MSMHEAFAGLFPVTAAQGVSGVSGVAQRKAVEISKALPETPSCNTLVVAHEKGVSPALDETPDKPDSGEGVSEKTKAIQCGNQHKTPATPETPPNHNTGAESSNQFHDHAAKFGAMPPRPAMYSAQRWQQIQTDAEKFAHLWGSQVSALGWNPGDVFAIPDGLIPLIEGGDILAVCEKTAVVRAPNRKQFNTIRFAALPGETAPNWRVWASWCEP